MYIIMQHKVLVTVTVIVTTKIMVLLKGMLLLLLEASIPLLELLASWRTMLLLLLLVPHVLSMVIGLRTSMFLHVFALVHKNNLNTPVCNNHLNALVHK